MGRNTEIYMFDKEKSTNFLYPDLKNKVFNKNTFVEYLNSRKREYGDLPEFDLDKILETVNNDINFIHPDQLWEIVNFIEEEIFQKFIGVSENHFKIIEAEMDKLYDLYGIIKLYEVHTSTVCYSYMFQFGNYRSFFEKDEKFEYENGYNLSSQDFLDLNDYMILMMDRIINNQVFDVKYSPYSEEDLALVKDIKLKFKESRVMNEAIEHELNWLIKCWNESKDSDSFKIETSTISYAGLFFSQSISMKKNIKEINPSIVITDSY